MVAMGRGGGRTPERVVELIKSEVERLGQNGTARAIGIPLYSVQKYMVGTSEPTKASLQKLADYFEVSVAWLRGEGSARDHFQRQELDVQLNDYFFSTVLQQHMMETILDIESSKNKYPQIWEAFLSVPDESKPEALDVMRKYCELSITGLKVFIERNKPSNEAKTDTKKPE